MTSEVTVEFGLENTCLDDCVAYIRLEGPPKTNRVKV